MKRLTKLTFGLLILLMFSGCGEAFKGQRSFDPDVEVEGDNLNSTLRSFDASETASRDQEILMSYRNEFTMTREELSDLNETFKAFDVIFTAKPNNQATLRARMALGCKNGLTFEADTSLSSLQGGQVVNLGKSGDYRVELQCTKTTCREMVVTIRKVAGSDRGLILMGLEVAGKVGDNQILFKYRAVNLYPFYAQMDYDHVTEYEDAKRCEVVSDNGKEDKNILDIFLNGDTSDLIDLGKDYLKDLF